MRLLVSILALAVALACTEPVSAAGHIKSAKNKVEKSGGIWAPMVRHFSKEKM
jgi:hypothetical protein